jgi:C4-dicarboxylate-specific signal transduction histidine kinase
VVTERIQLSIAAARSVEEALRRTETKLARAAQTATVGEFAASIAHEVNQPLSAVVASAHACLRCCPQNRRIS